MIILPEGFIYSQDKVIWNKVTPFVYNIRYLKYFGQVLCNPPYFAGLWDSPEYQCTVENLPEGLRWNASTESITGNPVFDQNNDGFEFTFSVLKNNKPLNTKKVTVLIGEDLKDT